jgi:hypothetical protein
VLLVGVVVAVGSLAASICTHRADYAVIGGAVLTLMGIPLTFLRLLRRGPAGVDDPDPPKFFPMEPGAKTIQFNMAYMYASIGRIVENFGVLTGVVLLLSGTVLAGIVAPTLAMIYASQELTAAPFQTASPGPYSGLRHP